MTNLDKMWFGGFGVLLYGYMMQLTRDMAVSGLDLAAFADGFWLCFALGLLFHTAQAIQGTFGVIHWALKRFAGRLA